MKCPICETKLTHVPDGRYGEYMTCGESWRLRLPKSHRNYHKHNEPVIIKDILSFDNFKPSIYQTDIKNYFIDMIDKDGLKALFVKATAGSGKTTQVLYLNDYLIKHNIKQSEIAIVSFGKDIADATKIKVENHNSVKTFHSIGRAMIVDAYGYLKVDKNKVKRIFQNMLGYNYKAKSKKLKELYYDIETFDAYYRNVLGLVSIYKNTQVVLSTNQENLEDVLLKLIDDYELTINSKKLSQTLDYATKCLAQSEDLNLNKILYIDYDDMIYYPTVYNLENNQTFKYLFVDELQDLNPLQMNIVEKLIDEDSKLVLVGDDNQAIFEWRGAVIGNVDKIIEFYNCEVFSLPISYRNSKAVGSFINTLFPDIVHEVLDDAIEGKVDTIDYNNFLSTIPNESLVMNYRNSDLVKIFFGLRKIGHKSIIKGGAIYKHLLSILYNLNCEDDSKLAEYLENWYDREVNQAMKKGKVDLLERLEDVYNTLSIVIKETDTFEGIFESLKEMFNDKKTKGKTLLSTIHKAKGLENPNVYIFNQDKLNMDTKENENVYFVACSRSSENLSFVVE